MPISLRTLCLVTAVLCNVQRSLEHGIPRRSFLSRRAIDGTRGRKYFDPNEEGAFDSYGSAGGQYDPFDHVTDLSDIRKNVPGEPGVDYPAYTTLPQTGFTCEGRSRGYYADEAAGCQVFHVCHDVLVSSFLCPIGSTFSQKLLTCDWWNKVDCSSTNRYLEVNQNSYQIDDDEMIRNAYVMISLQSAEDVTKDGLVDPDSGARIIDYSALGGRTIGYLSGFRRITDYPSVDATGNDLPNGFEDYTHQHDRQISNYDRYQQRTAKTNAAYQGKYHLEDKGRSPYHASPIIRHGYQDQSGDIEFQDDYRRSDGFTNRLQTSYAPTVPTVTTTTRRLYSPTVPTTYRPSTLAYSKLDLLMDSSDHLYAHSKSLGSLTTPPTIIRQNDDLKNIDSSVSETRRDDLKKSESVSSPKPDHEADHKDDGVRYKDDEVRLSFEEKSNTNFRINVTDMIDEDEVFRQQNDRPVIKNDSKESSEDIETKDSIGIARALNDLGQASVQNQTIDQPLKEERGDFTTLSPSLINSDHSPQSYANVASSTQILETNHFTINETSNDRPTENYDDTSTTSSFEETVYTRRFRSRTTPLQLNRNRQRNSNNFVESSTILTTTEPTIRRSFETTHTGSIDRPFNDSRRTVDQNSSSTRSVSNFNDGSVSRIDLGIGISQPAQFLEPPLESFLINIPEETRYTVGDKFETSWNPGITTEIPQFSNTPFGINQNESPVYNGKLDEQPLIDYADEGLSGTSNLRDHSTAKVINEVSTPIPWLVSSWHDRSIVNVPVTDIVPPIVDYNDGFGDFVPPNEHPYAELDHTKSQKAQNSSVTPKNDSETKILNQYNTDFDFTIRDAIKAQVESKKDYNSPCHSATSDKQARLCETSSFTPRVIVSTPSAQEKTISVGIKGRTPEQLISSGNTRLHEKSVTSSLKEFSTSTQSSITIDSNIDAEGSTLKTVTPRYVSRTEELGRTERPIETTTANNLPHTTRPGSLRQIGETIDRHNSPYQVSLTVKKEDLATTTDDFITRLITQHQQSNLKEQLGDFEIIKSVEPEGEVAPIPLLSTFSDSDYIFPSENYSSFFIPNDTTGQFKEPNSNVSMLSLLQLMAELLKLDRLPRPFSAKDLHNVELETSLSLDLDEDAPFVTTTSLFDRSQTRTPFRNTDFNVPAIDTWKTTANVAEHEPSPNVDQNKPSFVTTSPLLNYSKARTSFRNANFRPPNFDTSKATTKIVEPETSLNPGENKSSFVTTTPKFDHSKARTPFRNANTKVPSFDDISKIPSNVALKSSLDISSRIHPDHATESKPSRSKSERKLIRPLQKQEILEQLTENLGEPLYRDSSIHKSLVFDLPQVQRNLDFDTGLPVEESKYVTREAEEEDPLPSTIKLTTTMTTTSTSTTQKTTTTTEPERTIVKTEFVPSIGFSLNTNEDREEYVEAILGGLINDHANDDGGNESNVEQLTEGTPRNETSRAEHTQQSSKDV